ncbi:transposase [Micromonospora sp. B11E3]|uniref:transposase n=1 Tax=Micromonospora sp. B11E3 TaxID=3153562 RepID=UPI00325DB33E
MTKAQQCLDDDPEPGAEGDRSATVRAVDPYHPDPAEAGRQVAKLAGQVGFKVLPRRWVVERSLSWINRCRRTVRDYERLPEHHAAMVQWAMVIIMTRRLARPPDLNPRAVDHHEGRLTRSIR